MAEIVHRCPPGTASTTPCCGRTPFQLPRTDRMTEDPELMTCRPWPVTAGVVSAFALGAWSARFVVPRVPLVDVQWRLRHFVADNGNPLTAAVWGDPVWRLVLLRHPSVTHGTPRIPACREAAGLLAYATGWMPSPDNYRRTVGMTVAFGLREGYDPGSLVHSRSRVARYLRGRRDLTDVRLCSARLVDNDVRWYDEPGLFIDASEDITSSVLAAARRFGQDQVVVTNWADGRTDAIRIPAAQEGTS